MTTSPLAIDVFSDVVCPWCFIGKRRLEKAIAMRPDIPVNVRYRPYFLNPWVPREGMSRTAYLTTKFGSPGRYEQIAQRVAKAAEAEGLIYNIAALRRQPNTLDCHRLILWAGRAGKATQIKQRLMGTAIDIGAEPFAQGKGRADAWLALHASLPPEQPEPTPTPGPSPGQGCLPALLQLLFLGQKRE